MKSNRFLAILSIAALGLAAPAFAAPDAAAGMAKSKSCAGCHGANGEGKGKLGPIAGMDTKKFVDAMEEYKSGKRKDGMMKMATAKLSKEDIENLAAHYTSLKK
jgi:cytochrome c553